MPCIRSGMCCKILSLSLSPRELRDRYIKWQNTGIPDSDINIVYPMLSNRCLGKRYNNHYVYGPCKNLTFDKITSLPTCSIHESKPEMCREFPYYGRPNKVTIYKGCGFEEKLEGEIFGDLSGVLPLEENEK